MIRRRSRWGPGTAYDKPHLDLTTKLGQGFLAFLSALAEDERERIVRRAKDGRTAARRVGTKFGRKPKLNATQQSRARDMLSNGEPVRRVADEMNVHYSTISRLQR